MSDTREKIVNKYGEAKIGDTVYFRMENSDMWFGDVIGVLKYNDVLEELVIDTKNSGEIRIGQYLSAYYNSIRKI